MSPTLASLGIRCRSREERIAVVQEIWVTIAAEPHDPLLSEAQREELRRGVTEVDANPHEVMQLEQVMAQARSRFKQ
jgi:putative addiction module component (TIGR02574 family)